MGRDDIQRPYEEDPREQTGPLGPAQWHPEHPAGDVLSDGWNEIDLPDPTPGDGSQVIVHVDGSREIIRTDGSREMVYLDERHRDTDDTSDGPHHRDGDGETPTRGFLGSGWREDPDPGGKSKGRILLAVVGGVVVAGVAGGWMLSASVNGQPDTTCSPGARCSVADMPKPPSDTSAPRPEEQTKDPSQKPTTAPTGAPRTREPSARPSPARSAPTRETRPTRTAEETEQDNASGESPAPRTRITVEPTPSQTSQAPTESAEPSRQPTTAPPSQDTETNDDSGGGGRGGLGGLLDLLF